MSKTAFVDLLLLSSRRVLRAGGADRPDRAPTAVGYVFELRNHTPQLDLCAHFGPVAEDEDERWNSGDFDCPAGLTDAHRELGPEVWTAVTELHAAAAHEPVGGPTQQAITWACCTALLQLRAEGLIPAGADLVVSEVSEPTAVVAARGAALAAGEVPGAEPR
jgi:hypothetical protein